MRVSSVGRKVAARILRGGVGWVKEVLTSEEFPENYLPFLSPPPRHLVIATHWEI